MELCHYNSNRAPKSYDKTDEARGFICRDTPLIPSNTFLFDKFDIYPKEKNYAAKRL